MRFLPGTPDIPDELIKDVVEGHAVFICGAGVSKRVGLPLFRCLTEQIYADIGETPRNEAAEEEALKRGEYDRALRSLERRTRLPKARSRIRMAATKLLTPALGLSLPDHLNLLRLSRDTEGRIRLLTTNFDPLFECAAHADGQTVPSHAGKAIPRPGTPEDHGILHLHGRIAFGPRDIPPSDLILTSADFGDAYLRDGWAAQYIEERMRLNSLVLVGYRERVSRSGGCHHSLYSFGKHTPTLKRPFNFKGRRRSICIIPRQGARSCSGCCRRCALAERLRIDEDPGPHS